MQGADAAPPAETRPHAPRRAEAVVGGGGPPVASAVSLVAGDAAAFALRALGARAARRSLDLMYYYWREDATGLLLAREALAAADRGVRVRLLLDDLYAGGRAERALLALSLHPSVAVRLFNPFRLRSLGTLGRAAEFLRARTRLNHRMHNKAFVADRDRLALVGGRNVGDAYFGAADAFNFRDLDLALEGGPAGEASDAFARYWASGRARPVEEVVAARPLDGGLDGLRRFLDEAADAPPARAALARLMPDPVGPAREDAEAALEAILARSRVALPPGRARVVADPPEKGRRWGRRRPPGVLEAVRAAIGSARREALLVSPYFVPGRRGTRQLLGLARAGVRVAVLTNSLAATDVLAVHGGYARYRRRLLRAGVEIRELRPGPVAASPTAAPEEGRAEEGRASLFGSGGNASLHTKALLVDGGRAGFVGSFNLDPRSAHLNTEMGAFVEDAPRLGAALAEELGRLAHPSRSWAVTLGADGRLAWTGLEGEPVLHREPETRLGSRVLARVLGWLPIEPHL